MFMPIASDGYGYPLHSPLGFIAICTMTSFSVDTRIENSEFHSFGSESKP